MVESCLNKRLVNSWKMRMDRKAYVRDQTIRSTISALHAHSNCWFTVEIPAVLARYYLEWPRPRVCMIQIGEITFAGKLVLILASSGHWICYYRPQEKVMFSQVFVCPHWGFVYWEGGGFFPLGDGGLPTMELGRGGSAYRGGRHTGGVVRVSLFIELGGAGDLGTLALLIWNSH